MAFRSPSCATVGAVKMLAMRPPETPRSFRLVSECIRSSRPARTPRLSRQPARKLDAEGRARATDRLHEPARVAARVPRAPANPRAASRPSHIPNPAGLSERASDKQAQDEAEERETASGAADLIVDFALLVAEAAVVGEHVDARRGQFHALDLRTPPIASNHQHANSFSATRTCLAHLRSHNMRLFARVRADPLGVLIASRTDLQRRRIHHRVSDLPDVDDAFSNDVDLVPRLENVLSLVLLVVEVDQRADLRPTRHMSAPDAHCQGASLHNAEPTSSYRMSNEKFSRVGTWHRHLKAQSGHRAARFEDERTWDIAERWPAFANSSRRICSNTPSATWITSSSSPSPSPPSSSSLASLASASSSLEIKSSG
eukprot:2423328-Rhodomonas_salina.1